MLILAIHQTPTLTQERYEEVVRRLTGKSRIEASSDLPFKGLLVHAAGPGPDGFCVFDVFESEEAVERFRAALDAIPEEVGIEEPPRFFRAHTAIAVPIQRGEVGRAATERELDSIIGEFRRAARAFAQGDPEPVKALFSHAEDVALANPFGPAVDGWARVSEALDYASSRFRDGDVIGFERIATHVSSGLASTHEIERWQAKVGDSDDLASFPLRVSTTYRREDGGWKIVHRHADPIATTDPRGPLRDQRGAAGPREPG